MFIYFWARDRAWVGEGQREKETQKREGDSEQAPDSELSAQRPTWGSKLTNREIMTWAKVRWSTSWATQASPKNLFLRFFFFFLVISILNMGGAQIYNHEIKGLMLYNRASQVPPRVAI